MNITTIPPDTWNRKDSPPNKWTPRENPIKYIVLHTTGGTDSRGWLSKWNRSVPSSEQNNVSIHYLVQRDGSIFQIAPDNTRAWHVGECVMPDGERDGNGYAIGIEIEHLNEPDFPETQLNAVAWLVHTLMQKYNIPGKFIVSHASVAKPGAGEPHGPRKIDPVHFDWGDFWTRVLKLDTAPEEHKPQDAGMYPKSNMPYSAYSAMIGIPDVDEQKIAEFIALRQNQFYDAASLKLILSYYIKYGKETGVDWLLALAQCIHETGWFTSWWAQRPRRNPAGIGVTGQTTTTKPGDPQNWAFINGVWRRGQSYESWDIAVQHHLGRLLCYALKDGDMNDVQLRYSNMADGKDRLASVRGKASQFIGLNGVWAVPGTTYAQNISKIANSIIASAT